KRRTTIDRLLLVVEIAAVLLIGVIGVNLVRAITALEQETASAQALADEQRRAGIPTLEPTPTLRLEQVVLPGGHIYQAGAEPAFNFNEVPAHLHARVQAEWIQPVISRPPQTSETALSLIIPKLNLEGAIVQGVDVEALKQGVGQLPNGVTPSDDSGNVVLAAHNDVYGQLFRYLDTLAEGDTFQIRTQTRVFTYHVTGQQIVQPNDTYVLQNRDGATVTLISCYPYQVNTQRIVVFADRIS
ncbi:MAG: class D sortase, partial [Anaerolineae bacterium]|nr:class D sortase [Anaerolineae bacterium]